MKMTNNLVKLYYFKYLRPVLDIRGLYSFVNFYLFVSQFHLLWWGWGNMQLEPTAEMCAARAKHSEKHGTGAKRRRTTFIYYDEEHEIGHKCGKAFGLLLKKAKEVTG